MSSASLRGCVVALAFCALAMIGAPCRPDQERQHYGPPETHLVQIVPEEAYQKKRQPADGQGALEDCGERGRRRRQAFDALGAFAQRLLGRRC